MELIQIGKEERKKAPDGTPMQKLSEYEGIPIPEGFNVYLVNDEESVHQDQIFTFDEQGNHELIKPYELVKKIRKTREVERKIVKERLDQKKLETEKLFEEFLEEEQNISLSEYYTFSKSERKLFRDAFYHWLREKRGKDVDWNKRLEEFKERKQRRKGEN